MNLGRTPTKKAKPIRLCYGQLVAIFRNSIFNIVLFRNLNSLKRSYSLKFIVRNFYETKAVKMKQ